MPPHNFSYEDKLCQIVLNWYQHVGEKELPGSPLYCVESQQTGTDRGKVSHAARGVTKIQMSSQQKPSFGIPISDLLVKGLAFVGSRSVYCIVVAFLKFLFFCFFRCVGRFYSFLFFGNDHHSYLTKKKISI